MVPGFTDWKRITNITKKELVNAMAAKTDCSGAAADRAVNALVEIISDTLKKGDSLTLPGFGPFEVRNRVARTKPQPLDRRATENCRMEGCSIQTRCSARGCGQRGRKVRLRSGKAMRFRRSRLQVEQVLAVVFGIAPFSAQSRPFDPAPLTGMNNGCPGWRGRERRDSQIETSFQVG